MIFIAVLYAVVACWLAVYGANALFLTALFFLRRREVPPPPSPPDCDLPAVTVQLPVYNEKYVVRRLIDAACTLDYPLDRFEVQVLDDSTDGTAETVERRVRYWQQRGIRVEQVRRPDRREYKAGALAHGLKQANGDFIAIFDADFVPHRDWLRRAVAHFCRAGSERLGMVQSRWGHFNDGYSPLTRAVALALDGHFGVEQVARSHGGLLLNFNGTAGLWRRRCIEAAGGWSGRSLCEDLDLSYRAQLAGWQLRYDPTLVAPAEIPPQLVAFKGQQFRWAKGSIQVARLQWWDLLRSRLAPLQKLQGLLHLSGYLVHPLLVLLLLLKLPLLLWGWPATLTSQQQFLGWLGLAGTGAPILYGVSQYALHRRRWLTRYRWMPLLVLLGAGIALSNTIAILSGLFGSPGGEFRRTPKFRLVGKNGAWKGREYVLGQDRTVIGELVLAGYALLCCLVAAWNDQWFALPFLSIYFLAFGWVATLSIWQTYAGTGRNLPLPLPLRGFGR